MGMDAAVRAMFTRWEAEWRAARERWQKRCKGLREELHMLERTGGLVAQAGPKHLQNDPGGPRSDASEPAPSGLSPGVADKVDRLRGADTNCAKVLKRIAQTIQLLEKAQHTGAWVSDALVVAVKREKKFIAPVIRHIPRQETITVLEKDGEWLKVETVNGETGWIHVNDVSPKLPVEIRSTPGVKNIPEGMTEEEAHKQMLETERLGLGIQPAARG